MQPPKTIHRSNVIGLAWLASIALLACASSTFANTRIPHAKVLGDWEVSRVLVTKNTENATPPPTSGYARLIGLKFLVSADRVTSHWSLDDQVRGIAKAEGDSLAVRSKKPLSIRVLFEEEKIARPKNFRGLVRGKASDYALSDALGSLVNQPATLYGYVRDRFQDANPGSVTFAAVGDVLIMEHDEGTLLILRRPPKTKTAEHAAFCEKARSEKEKFICADRNLWLRYNYIQTTQPCALKQPADRNSNLANKLRLLREKAQKQEGFCNGAKLEESCVASEFDSEANLIGSHIPPTKMCINGEYRDMQL